MRNSNINISALAFLIADATPHSSTITSSILRGFGAQRVTEVRCTKDAIGVLLENPIDILLCDLKLPHGGGIEFVRSIRQQPNNPCRKIPILLTTGDTRVNLIKAARDAGSNMVVSKPMSPSMLYDRLVWVAFNPRKFVDAQSYFGPDRRWKIEGLPNGVGRRAEDHAVAVGDDVGPAMSQNEIDSLLKNARSGAAS